MFNASKRRISAFGILILSSFCEIASSQEIFSCKDKKGNVSYTDDIRKCNGGSERSTEIEQVDVSNINTHSQYGTTISEEYYNYAFRDYEALNGYKIKIIAEKKLIVEQPELLKNAAVKLERATVKAIQSFPVHVRSEFDGVKYYLFSGEESRTGGRKGGQWYFRKGNKISARFDDSIVIRSAQKYLEEYSEKRAIQTAVHELSHAYYHYHRNRLYSPVQRAFKNAVDKRLYRNVKHENGGLIKEAYAIRNQREYFAEISKIYFIGNYYSPFKPEELQRYDPEGYKIVRNAFLFGG